ncbi:DUF308 domain-containing protein [Thermoactinomyces mirandus]|uniref:DUF308 domain-containing protein n=1 Tax=Thermoactinomyces mirandus TaxID=2756294 RepID=A0A7W1XTR3_9BACL|nr:DUF308 domain-containing protein [Thermoactinomyces mirandus]MBA4603138.1 DUF308 domain-containing protein [Thermoactinomyces mirandus]
MENKEQFNQNHDQEERFFQDHDGEARQEERSALQNDEEVAQEVSPNPVTMRDHKGEGRENGKEAGGSGLGITALILSILAFFVWPFVLSIAGIVVGIFAVRRKSTLGWWAVAVGIVALIMALFLFPFRLLF